MRIEQQTHFPDKCIFLLCLQSITDMNSVMEDLQGDDKFRTIIQDLLHQPESHPGFQLKGGKLFYRGRLVISRNSPKIPLILNEFHDSAWGGHSRFFKTHKGISGFLYWEGMKKQIQQYVAECDICQKNFYLQRFCSNCYLFLLSHGLIYLWILSEASLKL